MACCGGCGSQKATVYELFESAAQEQAASSAAENQTSLPPGAGAAHDGNQASWGGREGTRRAANANVVYSLYDPRTKRYLEGVPWSAITLFIARSFSGTATTDPEMVVDWMLGPTFRQNREDPARLEVVRFWMDCTVASYGSFPSLGIIFASRPKGSPSSAPAAMLVSRKYPQGFTPQWGESLWIKWLEVSTQVPKAYNSSKYKEWKHALGRRAVAFDKIMHETHATHAPFPHWYISIIATAPEHEGQGHCSSLMRAMCRAADKENLACYLEAASDRNVAVYTTFGFQVVGKHTLGVAGDEVDNPPCDTFYCMLRPAA